MSLVTPIDRYLSQTEQHVLIENYLRNLGPASAFDIASFIQKLNEIFISADLVRMAANNHMEISIAADGNFQYIQRDHEMQMETQGTPIDDWPTKPDAAKPATIAILPDEPDFAAALTPRATRRSSNLINPGGRWKPGDQFVWTRMSGAGNPHHSSADFGFVAYSNEPDGVVWCYMWEKPKQQKIRNMDKPENKKRGNLWPHISKSQEYIQTLLKQLTERRIENLHAANQTEPANAE